MPLSFVEGLIPGTAGLGASFASLLLMMTPNDARLMMHT